ncbi:MAG: hypothetical protein KTR20_08260 [Cellvibrionaceae bacterium]|nr:hypothetical protein [Cellvibrionaceae bacterium]
MITTNYRPAPQAGIGLIEIMVSMLIGLFIMAGVVQMFSTTHQHALTAMGSNVIQENVRYAFSRIEDDIRRSGNLGCISASVDNTIENTLDDDEGSIIKNQLRYSLGANQLYDYKTIIGGHDNATTTTPPLNTVAIGTDTFMVRYASQSDRILVADPANDVTPTSITVDPDDPNYSALSQYQIVIVSNCSRGAVFMVTNDPESSDGLIEHRTGVVVPSGYPNSGQSNAEAENRLVDADGGGSSSLMYLYTGSTGSYQYFIGTRAAGAGACNTATARQNCALFRRGNGVNEELLVGVHDMDVEYGWTLNNVLTFGSATAVSLADTWNVVDRIKLTLSFNSVDNAISSGGNAINELLVKDVTRTIYLPNQL